MCLVCRGRIHATHPVFFCPLQGPHICGPYTPFGKAVSHCPHSDITGAFSKEQPPLPPLDRGARKSKTPSARRGRIAFLYPPVKGG